MTHKSKAKGNHFERELVNIARDSGFEAKRAYASNGQSLGHHEEVDLVITGSKVEAKVQAKRRARIAEYITPSENVDVVAVREDFGQPLVVLSYCDYLDLLKELDNARVGNGSDAGGESSSSDLREPSIES